MRGRLANVQTIPSDLRNAHCVFQPCWLVTVEKKVVSIGQSQMGFGKLTGL